MRRVLTFVIILMIAMPSNMATVLAQSGSCAACQPSRSNHGWDVASGDLNVCFASNQHHTWTVDERAWIIAGMEYWTAVLAEQGRTITLHTEVPTNGIGDCSSDSIKASWAPNGDLVNSGATAEAGGTSNGRNGTIKFNKDVIDGSYGYFMELAAHEFGHFFDFANVGTGCAGKSVMVSGATFVSLSQVDKCSDRTAATTRYQGGNADPGNNYSDPLGGDCYEWLRVTFWENFDGSQWNYVGFTIDADLGSYCGPPPY